MNNNNDDYMYTRVCNFTYYNNHRLCYNHTRQERLVTDYNIQYSQDISDKKGKSTVTPNIMIYFVKPYQEMSCVIPHLAT